MVIKSKKIGDDTNDFIPTMSQLHENNVNYDKYEVSVYNIIGLRDYDSLSNELLLKSNNVTLSLLGLRHNRSFLYNVNKITTKRYKFCLL